MSIQSEITRLAAAKSDLKTAINLKGGTLTDESISAYAAAVEALGGGELTAETLQTTTGSSLGGSITFTGLKNEPSLFVIQPDETVSTSGTASYIASVSANGSNVYAVIVSHKTKNTSISGNGDDFSWTYGDGTLSVGTSNSYEYFFASTKYNLIYAY